MSVILSAKDKILRSSIVEGLYYSLSPKLIFGDDYTKMRRHLQLSEYWDPMMIQNYQKNKIKELLIIAYNNVPYYTDLFNSISFDPRIHFKRLSDLKNIPLLSRSDVKTNQERLINVTYPKHRLFLGSTSGSSGHPLTFYRDIKLDMALETAFRHHMFDRIGYNSSEKEIVLRGHTFQDNNDTVQISKKQGFKRVLLSSYHLTNNNLQKYHDTISQFNPKFLWSYPSSAHLLSRLVLSNNYPTFNSIKGIILASENIYNWQIDDIQKVFPAANIIGFYGNSERNVIASWCQYSNEYHFEFLYGFVELLDEFGNEIEKSGEIGEIVVTGFLNKAFPFIRYRTGDLAKYTGDNCRCGRNHYRVSEIMGRVHERLLTADNRLIPLPTISIHNESFRNVLQIQFEQNTSKQIIVRIVRSPSFSSYDELTIRNELRKKIGKATQLDFKYVKNIPTSARGKHKILIQNIPNVKLSY